MLIDQSGQCTTGIFLSTKERTTGTTDLTTVANRNETEKKPTTVPNECAFHPTEAKDIRLAKSFWIDVEDLFLYARDHHRPSGIQRFAYELCQALQARLGAQSRVHFVRIDPARKTFITVSWQSVEGLFSGLSNETPPQDYYDSRNKIGIRPEGPFRRRIRLMLYRMRPEIRIGLIDAARSQANAARAVASLLSFLVGTTLGRVRRAFRSTNVRLNDADQQSDQAGMFSTMVRPGDILLTVGAPWSHPHNSLTIEITKARYDFLYGFLVYDIIAIRRPEWFDKGLAEKFRSWLISSLPLADAVFAISQYTATDVERFANELAIPLRHGVRVVTPGADFEPDEKNTPPLLNNPVIQGDYVLFVSTIEARKNHMLLFRIWRRMLEEMPASTVPTLVFVGREGWLVADLMKQLENTNYLDHKIVVLSGISDSVLRKLYIGCLFTIFPSLCEGWGLPVSESLALGKPCLASNKAAIPEAGGRFCRYFDPDDFGQTYRLITETINDREGVAEWGAEIRREFRPTSWTTGAEVIIATLDMREPS